MAFRTRGLSIFAGAALLAVGGCDRSGKPANANKTAEGEDQIAIESGQRPQVLGLEEVKAADETVNAFVREVIDVCLAGRYGDFRLLWTARSEPVSRGAFESAYHAVRTVQVQRIVEFRDTQDNLIYGLHARVYLADEAPEPERDVILLVLQEKGQWRLAPAPKEVRAQLLAKQAADTQPAATQPAGSPAAPSGPPPPSQ